MDKESHMFEQAAFEKCRGQQQDGLHAQPAPQLNLATKTKGTLLPPVHKHTRR